MTYITVSQYVDIDIDLDDIDTDDLASELIKRKGYAAALDKALNESRIDACGSDYDRLRELVECYRLNKPIENIIATIAYEQFGLVC